MSFSTGLELERWTAQAGRLWLFLDYDGTLVEFAPTPDDVRRDPALNALLAQLAANARLRLVILSGRDLSSLRALVPVAGVFLAGVYGIELQAPSGEKLERADFGHIRPVLERLKPQWQSLMDGRPGFFLEDKGWSLALHASHADDAEASRVIAAASRMVDELHLSEEFRRFYNPRFLEIAPALAHKGKTVSFICSRYPWPEAVPLYIGDDDKDEEAFATVHSLGGVAISVAHLQGPPPPAQADFTLASPQAVRGWLSQSFLR